MNKGRLEAFSDGVIAIIITIMVLSLEAPKGTDLEDLAPLIPKFVCYLLSFIFVGIYWNNHHHMMQMVKSVGGMSLWANLNLLFWLSLIPFATDWMGENNFTTWPVVLYGVVLLMCAIAYSILYTQLVKHHDGNRELQAAVGDGRKEKLSLVLYIVAIITAFIYTWISLGIFVFVAAIWFIPDTRIEKHMEKK
ncbi:MAG TPA: TMEM175 family protein [Flavipsychrobacter sp.]|nr:TMEM175 family protein [Flavipsychrobacter sp.]